MLAVVAHASCPSIRRLRQNYYKFGISLEFRVRFCLNQTEEEEEEEENGEKGGGTSLPCIDCM